MPLRPTIVITGSIRVEGGDKRVAKQREESRDADVVRQAVTQTREVTTDRRDANVVSTGYMRRVRLLRVVNTPFGALIDAEKLKDVKELIASADKAVADFNKQRGVNATAQLTNGMLWEPLRGNRLLAVESWLSRGVAKKDPEAVQAVKALAPLSPS